MLAQKNWYKIKMSQVTELTGIILSVVNTCRGITVNPYIKSETAKAAGY